MPILDRAFDFNLSAMRLHDALGDGEPETGALTAIRTGSARVGTSDKLLEYVRHVICRDTGAIVAHAQLNSRWCDIGVQLNLSLWWGVQDCITNDIANRLLSQRRVGAHERKIGWQTNLDVLLGAMAPCGAHHPVHDLA